MPEYLSPGVYVEEFESGSRPMEGVGTSTAGFIGLSMKGPDMGVPQLVTNFAEFKRKYGDYLSAAEFGEYRFLAYAVEHFFINGGTRAFIMRVAPSDAKCAKSVSNQNVLSFTAKNPGQWGNFIRIAITPASKARTQILEVQELPQGKMYRLKTAIGFQTGDIVAFSDGEKTQYSQITIVQDNLISLTEDLTGDVADTDILPKKTISTSEMNIEVRYDDIVEFYENVSLNQRAASFVKSKMAKSELLNVEYTPFDANTFAKPQAETPEVSESEDDVSTETVTMETVQTNRIITPFQQLTSDNTEIFVIGLDGGQNGTQASLTATDFIGVDNGPGKRTGIQSFIDNDFVSIMAIPGVTDPNVQLSLVAHCELLGSRFAILDIPREDKKIDDVIKHRQFFDSAYAALYHPWLEVFDPLDKRNIAIPPSGSVAGIYARSDNTRGVYKAPANEVVRSCVGLDCCYNKGEQDILNPKGVNLIRVFPGQGIRVWGARTASSNSLWKYVNVRRLFIFIEESIKANTNWVVFEPNDELLWVRVKRTIDVFLNGVWRSGALAGGSPAEAFYVNVDRSTMSQDDIDNGRLICVIGIAPVKPAEFVIFRITQKTASE